MQLRSKYSAISFAALALAFSFATVAASAEVSGDHPTVKKAASLATDYKGYLAYSQYAGVPSTTVYAPAPPAVVTTKGGPRQPYDSTRLDALQSAVTAELEALIELRGF